MSRKCVVVNEDKKIYVYQNYDTTYEAEGKINLFASIIKTPEGIHTYEVDEDSLWSAAALGIKSEYIFNTLEEYSKNKLSSNIYQYINKKIKEFWTVKLYIYDDGINILGNIQVIEKIICRLNNKNIQYEKVNGESLKFDIKDVNVVKENLIYLKIYFIEIYDKLIQEVVDFKVNVNLYEYQQKVLNEIVKVRKEDAMARGVITMPPGSGKTIIGLKVIEFLKVKTLIIVENDYSAENWIRLIKSYTNINYENISVNEYNGEFINIFTYNRAKDFGDSDFRKRWGLIIYDDARKLATSKNRKLAYIPSPYKLAMGSYLERDGNEIRIYRAVGPKLFNITLNEMKEVYGQIPVECCLIMLPKINLLKYNNEAELKLTALQNVKHKLEAIRLLDIKHKGKKLYASHYKDVAYDISSKYNDIPVIHGKGNNINDEYIHETLQNFNNGDILSIIGTQIIERLQFNSIQSIVTVSIRGDSDRDEYIRIGKLKSSYPLGVNKVGYYYSVITEDSKEEEKYSKTMDKMFRHGYVYKIITLDELRDMYEN